MVESFSGLFISSPSPPSASFASPFQQPIDNTSHDDASMTVIVDDEDGKDDGDGLGEDNDDDGDDLGQDG